MKKSSAEIPDHTSVKKDNAEPVFHRYRKGGCHSWRGRSSKIFIRISFQICLFSEMADTPKNAIKMDVLYRA